MIKAGFVLNAFGFILTQGMLKREIIKETDLGMTLTYGAWLFDLHHVPDWARHNATSM
jgi:hypothetical protein